MFRMMLYLKGISFPRLIPKVFKVLSKSRCYSSLKDNKPCVVLSNNGQIVVCWHPEQHPPYEHTKPLPVIPVELHEGDSVLKLQYRRDGLHRFQPDGPTIEQLAKITYTTKHRWYPNLEKRYEDPPPFDREGI